MTITQEFIEVAQELINDFVPTANAVWNQLADGIVADPNKPWEVTRGAVTQFNVRILFIPDDLEDRQFVKYRKDAETIEGQIKGLMYHEGFTPNAKDFVTWQGKRLVVRSIDVIRPIDDVILYILEFGL